MPKEKKKMDSKEGMSVNLVIGRWNYCLELLFFLANFPNSVVKSLSENEGSKKTARLLLEVVIHEFIVVPICLLYD